MQQVTNESLFDNNEQEAEDRRQRTQSQLGLIHRSFALVTPEWTLILYALLLEKVTYKKENWGNWSPTEGNMQFEMCFCIDTAIGVKVRPKRRVEHESSICIWPQLCFPVTIIYDPMRKKGSQAYRDCINRMTYTNTNVHRITRILIGFNKVNK